MSHAKIEMPSSYKFTCEIPVRITDVNYGGHVGNDAILSIIHEARMQFLEQMGYSEMNLGGVGLMMTRVGIEYKRELFHKETVIASVAVGEISSKGFDLYYLLEKITDGKKQTFVNAFSSMICYSYENKKVTNLPEEAKLKLQS